METTEMDLTILMPCLNEAETLEICIAKALSSIDKLGLSGEVLVADNGSTDGSQQLAERLGARIVHVPEKGYGSALAGGIRAARGKWIIMGDADDSYNFGEIAPFVDIRDPRQTLTSGMPSTRAELEILTPLNRSKAIRNKLHRESRADLIAFMDTHARP